MSLYYLKTVPAGKNLVTQCHSKLLEKELNIQNRGICLITHGSIDFLLDIISKMHMTLNFLRFPNLNLKIQ